MLNKLIPSLNTSVKVASFLIAGTLFSATAHAGAHCKNVYVSALNKTGAAIKIVDMDYYDPAYSKWRSEPTKNQIIPAGRNWQETRRLERVNAKNTYVRIEYRKPKTKGIGKWSKIYTAYSARKTCHKGSNFQIILR